MSIRHVAFRAILLASAASVPVASFAQPAGSPSTQSGTSDVIRVLLDQSAYWRTKSETKLADEALSRVLALDPGNVDALAQQAQAAADKGDRKTAQDALTKLQAARPDDPRITSIQQSLRIGPVDQSALTEARRLAQDGKPQQALDAYRRVFKGDVPPPSLATEFYQTLGATEGNWEAAREGLAAHLRADPQDLSAQLAYAALLTYRDETRDEGVQRLAFLTREAQVSQQADRAWRQALSWLPATQASAAKYTEYLAHNPDDTEVQHWRTVALNDTGTLRGAGFDDLANNRVAQAESEFTKALAVDANDSDSLIGLALVRFKQNRQNDGRELIRKAIEIDPSKATQYQSMLDTSAASRTGNGGGNGRNGSGVDYGAESARKIRGQYARVAALTQRGEYAAAEALLRQLMGNRPNAGNYLQMGDIQRRAGQFGAAEASFRTVLRSQPHNVAALGGLAAVLGREGKTTDADQAYAQAQSFGGGNALGQNRAQQLRQQAQSVSDPVARTGLFRAAVAADPANPWLRLELARALLAQDREAEARSVMAPVTDTARPTVDQLKAGIYFATSDHQNALAASLVARLPASARTPDMQEIGVQAEVAGDVQDAKQLPNVDAMEQRMVALAAKPDPTGARASQFANALTRAGDKPGARNVIRAALAASRTPTPQQRIAYAGALIGAGYPRDAKVVTAGLSPGQLNPLQRSTLTSLQDDAAVSAADSANSRGQTADALSELTPRLQRDPSNPALNMALARVYQTEKQPGTAVAITQELLRRNPGDVQVRVAAVSAALAAGEADRAATMARQLTADFPEDPQGWFVAAQVARSRGDSGAALTDLRRARDLRAKQLAGEQSDASDVLVPGWLPGRQYALNWPPNVLNDASPGPAPQVADAEPVTREYERYAQNTAAPYSSGPGQIYLPPPNGLDPGTSLTTPPGIGVRATPPPSFSEPSPIAATPVAETLPSTPNLGILTTIPAANPTRSTSAPTLDEPTAGSNLGVQLNTWQRAPTDPLTADIDRSIQQVSETIAPQIAGSLSLRGRSGSQGLSELFDVEAPLEASFSPNGYGRLKVQVTPVYLYTGQPSAGNRALFGTNPLIAGIGADREHDLHPAQPHHDGGRQRFGRELCLRLRHSRHRHQPDRLRAEARRGRHPIPAPAEQQPAPAADGGPAFGDRQRAVLCRADRLADGRALGRRNAQQGLCPTRRLGRQHLLLCRRRCGGVPGRAGCQQHRCGGRRRCQHPGVDDADAGSAGRRQRGVFRLPPQRGQLHHRQWRLFQPAAVFRTAVPGDLQAAADAGHHLHRRWHGRRADIPRQDRAGVPDRPGGDRSGGSAAAGDLRHQQLQHTVSRFRRHGDRRRRQRRDRLPPERQPARGREGRVRPVRQLHGGHGLGLRTLRVQQPAATIGSC